MEYKVAYKQGKGRNGADLLQIEGILNITNVQLIKNSILEKLSQSQALQVLVKNAEQFDFSFLQLLIGLKIKYKAEQKPIYFELDLDEENKRALVASGFSDLLLAKY